MIVAVDNGLNRVAVGTDDYIFRKRDRPGYIAEQRDCRRIIHCGVGCRRRVNRILKEDVLLRTELRNVIHHRAPAVTVVNRFAVVGLEIIDDTCRLVEGAAGNHNRPDERITCYFIHAALNHRRTAIGDYNTIALGDQLAADELHALGCDLNRRTGSGVGNHVTAEIKGNRLIDHDGFIGIEAVKNAHGIAVICGLKSFGQGGELPIADLGDRKLDDNLVAILNDLASFGKLNGRGVDFEILKRQIATLGEFNERRRIFATAEIIRRNHLHRLSDDYAFAELHAALRHVRHNERHVGGKFYVLNRADIIGEVNRALKLLTVAVDGEVGVFVNKHFGNFHIIENTHLDLRFSGTLIDHGENLLAVINNGVPRKRRSTGKAADA